MNNNEIRKNEIKKKKKKKLKNKIEELECISHKQQKYN